MSVPRACVLGVAVWLAGCSTHHGGNDQPDAEGPPDVAVDMPPDAAAAPFASEMGFIELDPVPGHMFYILRSADSDPGNKPLFVLFNGGPGFPTSLGLVLDATGPMFVQDDGTLATNPDTLTQYGSLLYLDQRETGFSYDDQPATTLDFDMLADADDFVRAIMRVMDGHPELTSAPVIIFGESYGGTRATLVLDDILQYTQHGEIQAEVQAHLDKVFTQTAGTNHAPTEIAKQFGTQVLIEPVTMAGLQFNDSIYPPDMGCPYDTRLTADQCALEPPPTAVIDPTLEVGLFGGKLDDVAKFSGPNRHGFRMAETDPVMDAINMGLAMRLGGLDSGDLYTAYGPNDPSWSDDTTINPAAFVRNLGLVKTFITHATYDADVDSTAIQRALVDYGTPATIDMTMPAGAARPGVIDVTLPTGTIQIRFPTYAAGHMVTRSTPTQLRQDVADWLGL
ncbi:MAG TPA: hypothetical protein VLX92_27850 [Kofleriaceae bacterium]|nr:hypothetical protein [Kofleriaceae bacterium]